MEELKIVTNIQICAYNELSEVEKTLIDNAKAAAQKAYAPYSKFKVGASILLENSVYVSGNNQENVAYPSGLCAERTAMFYANARHPELCPQMIAIAAYTQEGGFTEKAISPCGACRQVLLETENRYRHPIRVLLYGESEIMIVQSIKDLLPLGFTLCV